MHIWFLNFLGFLPCFLSCFLPHFLPFLSPFMSYYSNFPLYIRFLFPSFFLLSLLFNEFLYFSSGLTPISTTPFPSPPLAFFDAFCSPLMWCWQGLTAWIRGGKIIKRIKNRANNILAVDCYEKSWTFVSQKTKKAERGREKNTKERQVFWKKRFGVLKTGCLLVKDATLGVRLQKLYMA